MVTKVNPRITIGKETFLSGVSKKGIPYHKIQDKKGGWTSVKADVFETRMKRAELGKTFKGKMKLAFTDAKAYLKSHNKTKWGLIAVGAVSAALLLDKIFRKPEEKVYYI